MATATYSSPPSNRPYPSHAPPNHQPYYGNQTTLPLHTRDRPAADQYDGPPIPPPRSSSQQQQSSAAAWSPPSTAPLDARVAASRYARQDGGGPGYPDAPARYVEDAVEAARDRTRDPAAAIEDQRRAREQAGAASSTAPPPLIREHSEIINRVVVSDPQVDVQRLQERVAEAHPIPRDGDATAVTGLGLVGREGVDDAGRGGSARRQDYSRSASKKRDIQFGDYMLGQTLGEGEFGKVKLGWKKDGSSQVAIKLIRRETVATNPSRLPKIYREISILRDLAHPNIVRLHEMVETERHIGIILEYASGGELFDYILNHRYLKDPQARRLFAQLISGVGYLHKKGIVHRDLKLENLLLDTNKNIIITDFGFANTFNPADALSDEIEYNLGNREFVKKYRLDRQDEKGMRRGDLMQTSCGSPCYAAPELVVSDSLYTGRKVDVWSCGVILYAMLAGYLPFDDDPANPEGDNINLLYKYITTTPLTFPEYVTPHARDLLRRILVADPRKRADLFEVARHSWLSEYHHVVSHITSSTTNVADIANTTVASYLPQDSPGLNRSASVREPHKTPNAASPARLAHQAGPLSPVEDVDTPTSKTRHTLQPEYVAPKTHTSRGEVPLTAGAAPNGQPSRADAHDRRGAPSAYSKPLPQEPPASGSPAPVDSRMPPPTRPARDVPRSVSDSTGAFATAATPYSPVVHPTTRPSTGGSLPSATGPSGTRSDVRLPSRGSYGQPVAPTVATTNAQGRVTQPKASRGYNISGPIGPPGHVQQAASIGQPMSPPMPGRYTETSASPPPSGKGGHHRRSSTLSGLGERLFGRSASVKKQRAEADATRSRTTKKYPPSSMKEPYATDGRGRASIDSKRSFSFGLGRKRSTDLESQEEKPARRFSLLPNALGFRGAKGASRDRLGGTESPQSGDFPRPPTTTWTESRPPTGPARRADYGHDGPHDAPPRPSKVNNFSRPPQTPQQPPYQQPTDDVYGGTGVYAAHSPYPDRNPPSSYRPPSSPYRPGPPAQPNYAYPDGFNSGDAPRASMQQERRGKGVLMKTNRKFTDSYDNEQGPTHHGGSSGAVRKVQDFFRRRGRARADSGYR